MRHGGDCCFWRRSPILPLGTSGRSCHKGQRPRRAVAEFRGMGSRTSGIQFVLHPCALTHRSRRPAAAGRRGYSVLGCAAGATPRTLGVLRLSAVQTRRLARLRKHRHRCCRHVHSNLILGHVIAAWHLYSLLQCFASFRHLFQKPISNGALQARVHLVKVGHHAYSLRATGPTLVAADPPRRVASVASLSGRDAEHRVRHHCPRAYYKLPI